MQQPQALAPDCDALRQQLRAPDPMQRAMALHALEVEVERGGPRPLANEVLRFTERGIPYYALHDPHFCDWVSKAVVSNGEYGVPAGLVFGYPTRSDGKGNLKVVEGLKLDAFGQERFKITLKELEEEREAVKELLPT